ncbi:unnamed protein product [Didymodactylos carnosus]|uniref:Uncharacterized protein n=1 Tax=Didymodactylos carnosus TaxID=1234261 RepID=A0A813NXE8_9BILA|nr:unnamed protein product [Didymodactylos carnosus]CAF0774119.1 unnamed protein product [Didymodactylos carnosus]CAF3520352.1 unnamed protein product [Didymodactylos carnosus]CAF3555189.1 unnamed protein product [Didymodactylos carnosus]
MSNVDSHDEHHQNQRPSLSSTRLYDKLDKCKRDKDFYQAHQIYRTIYFRLINQPHQQQENFVEILDFIYNGAKYFLDHQQSNSGYDLCKCFVEILNKQEKYKELNEGLLSKICKLYELLRPYRDERIEYAYNILRWSETVPSSTSQQQQEELPLATPKTRTSFSSSILSTLTEPSSSSTIPPPKIYHKSGHPEVHERFAKILWNEKNYKDSRYHFLHSHDGIECANMLIDLHTNYGYPSEVDLFITQVVLQYLCLKNFHTAYLVFVTYVERHPLIQQPPPFHLYPILNFVWFLLLCLKKMLVRSTTTEQQNPRDIRTNLSSYTDPQQREQQASIASFTSKVKCFSTLCELYKPSLNRDTTLLQYLERIGQLFFGIKQQQSSNRTPNMFENLFQNLANPPVDSSSSNSAQAASNNFMSSLFFQQQNQYSSISDDNDMDFDLDVD